MTQKLQYDTTVALSKETTWGTPVAPTVLIAASDVSENPDYERIQDNGLRGIGSRDFRSIQGGGRGELSFEGIASPVEIGHLLLAILGAVNTTGTTVWTHTFTRDNNPPSYTIETEIDAGGTDLGMQTSGARCGELGFSFDAASGVLQFSSSWIGKIPTKVTGASPAEATIQDAWPGWSGTVVSTGLDGIIVSAECTLSRELEPIHTAQNSQDPKHINVGPLGFEGRLVVVAEDLADFDAWKANTEQSFVITFTYGAGDNQRSFKLTSTLMNIANGPFEIDRSAVGVTFGIPFIGLHNATDSGPVQVELINNQAAY